MQKFGTVSQKLTEIMRFKFLSQLEILPHLRRKNVRNSPNFKDRELKFCMQPYFNE